VKLIAFCLPRWRRRRISRRAALSMSIPPSRCGPSESFASFGTFTRSFFVRSPREKDLREKFSKMPG
jgi:hypothetical protein